MAYRLEKRGFGGNWVGVGIVMVNFPVYNTVVIGDVSGAVAKWQTQRT
jgi:hypothetical protein